MIVVPEKYFLLTVNLAAINPMLRMATRLVHYRTAGQGVRELGNTDIVCEPIVILTVSLVL